MELVSHYQELHKKRNPWLEWFLQDRELPGYQKQLLETLSNEKHSKLYYAHMARGNQKESLQLERLEEHFKNTLQISTELSEHIKQNDAMQQVLNKITERAAQAMEQRLMNQSSILKFENKSQIDFDMFRREYLSQWGR